MEKIRRNERMSAILKMLTDSPNQILPLSQFCTVFDTAKSTMSEDISLLKVVARQFGLGEIETIPGASGGVRWRCAISREQAMRVVSALCEKLSGDSRVLPGGFLYYSDILSDPVIVRQMGEILATEYFSAAPDFVLTMETKGIPVALETARALGVPLVIARHTSKVYEGSAVHINYVSDSSGAIQTMSLARRSVKEGQKALIIDDFLRGGGTAKGMVDLMGEFNIQVVGMGFVMETASPAKKRVTGQKSLMTLELSPSQEQAVVRPAPWLLG